MIKIKMVVNVNKHDVIHSYMAGQLFPKLDCKLISIEVSGKELERLAVERRSSSTRLNVSLVWRGRHAG